MFKSSVLFTLLGVLFFFTFFLLPVDVFAQLNFTPQVDIPNGVEGKTLVGKGGQSTLLGQYIEGIYNYSLGIGGILAAIVLMGGGVMWLVSGGNQAKIGQAKDIILGSIVGLGLLFSAYLLLNTINPALLDMKPISITNVSNINSGVNACCQCDLSVKSGPTGNNYQTTLILATSTCASGLDLTKDMCEDVCKLEATSRIVKDASGKVTQFAESIPDYKVNQFCGTGSKTNTCVDLPDDHNLLYSSIFINKGWRFQTGIQKQIPDMSEELAMFLNCMRDKLPDGIGEISSISDSNYIGKLHLCNTYSCPISQPPLVAKPCVHSCSSCHYGGGLNTNKSYAVDFGDEGNYEKYKKAALECDSGAYVLLEDTHVHASVSKCPKQ